MESKGRDKSADSVNPLLTADCHADLKRCFLALQTGVTRAPIGRYLKSNRALLGSQTVLGCKTGRCRQDSSMRFSAVKSGSSGIWSDKTDKIKKKPL